MQYASIKIEKPKNTNWQGSTLQLHTHSVQYLTLGVTRSLLLAQEPVISVVHR